MFEIALSSIISCFISVCCFGVIKHHMNKRFKEKDEQEAKEKKQRYELNLANRQLSKCTSKLFFWMYRALSNPTVETDLDGAWENYNNAEKEVNNIEMGIITSYTEDN